MDNPIDENKIVSKFLVDSNQAVKFKLVRNEEDIQNDKTCFNPGMSHQVFGAKENIFGFSNLDIKLYYTAGSLHQYYQKSFETQISKTDGGIDPDNIEEKLNENYILDQENCASSIGHFGDMVRKDKDFKPFGSKVTEFKRNSRHFEIYKPTMADPGFKEWYLRLETFILWFIDGSQYINTDDVQWDYFTLFERFQNQETGKNQYAIAGFSTVFRFYCYPEKIRPRVSQILVMPPFQRMGLGSTLLENIYTHYNTSDVLEITMEDPSDDCQRVRDFIDARNCTSLPEFGRDFINKGWHPCMYTSARDKFKINKKQARRIYEILRLKFTPKFDEKAMKLYRLDIKNRLNAPHKNENLRKKRVMAQVSETVSEDDRKRQLQSEYEEIVGEYDKVIARLNRFE